MTRRLLGLAFVAVLLSLTTLSVLAYRKVFTPVIWVTLLADHTGMQLNDGADVKLRGVVVGDVRQVSTDGHQASVRLALNPAVVESIPANVTARLLPTTLFGEKYVQLVAPDDGSTAPIQGDAVISQDRTQAAVELEQVLDNALPLLQAIHPDKLAATLGALAYALDGRGERLGHDLLGADTLLGRLNQELPVISEDVRRLAGVLDVYNGAADDLVAILRDLTVTANTVADQRAQLAGFLIDTADLADTARIFLDRHGDRLIQLGQVSRPVLDLLAVYAPEYPCLLRGIVALKPQVETAFDGGRLHITLEVTKDNGKYVSGRDTPAYSASGGPNCRGLPDPPLSPSPVPINDGYGDVRGATFDSSPADQLRAGTSMGYAGTTEERGLIKSLLGASTATPASDVPDIAVLLWGPLMRGTVVNVS